MNLSMAQRAIAGGAIWVAVGVMLVVRGILPHFENARALSPTGAALWLAGGLVVGAAKGWFVIRKSAVRMVGRIEAHPEPAPFWQIYPPIFALLLPLMIGMGLGVRFLFQESHPGVVTAVYCGIGAALVASSIPFFTAWKRLRESPRLRETPGS